MEVLLRWEYEDFKNQVVDFIVKEFLEIHCILPASCMSIKLIVECEIAKYIYECRMWSRTNKNGQGRNISFYLLQHRLAITLSKAWPFSQGELQAFR